MSQRKPYTMHGLSYTPEYKAWQHMIERCYDPWNSQYHNYGERGITMCDEWRKDFIHFYKDMGNRPTPKHEIDRINNDEGYSKDNCRWATREQQCNNRRGLNLVTINGVTKSATAHGRDNGIKQSTVVNRICRGWDVMRACTEAAKW